MKNNKKLTLKALKAQLDELGLKNVSPVTRKSVTASVPLTSKISKKQTKDNNSIKTTVTINPLKSSLLVLYGVSLISFLSNKIPILNRFGPYLVNLLLGKSTSTFFYILGWLRKGFVLFNALIGMYAIFKLTGFTEGSYMSAFAGIGSSYIEILKNFVFKTFNWLLEFFDMKVVPQIPNNKPNLPFSPSSGPGWFTKPMGNNNFLEVAENAKSWYKSPVDNYTTPWYRDWSWTSLFYVIGGVTIIVSGYMLYSWITSTGPAAVNNAPVVNDNNAGTGGIKTILTTLFTPFSFLGKVKQIIPGYISQPELQPTHIPSTIKTLPEFLISNASDGYTAPKVSPPLSPLTEIGDLRSEFE